MTTELLDARGVAIAPGDTVIYGFGVSRSVAMAEAVVLGENCQGDGCTGGDGDGWECTPKVSLTPSGRVRLRVVRRSYGGGENPNVDVAPDRLVVLKKTSTHDNDPVVYLPPSPLPTQDEEVRAEIERGIGLYTERLRETEPPRYWEGYGTPAGLADYHAWCARQLTDLRRKLRRMDEA